MAEDEPVGLCDLPPELLQEIINHLDNPSLLQFGLTCKHTHYIALSTFFSQNSIRGPSDGWLVAYKTPPETLHAIRAALWVTELKQIHYYLHAGVDSLLSDVSELYHLVKRVANVQMLMLHFSVVDSWITSGSVNGKALGRTLDREKWLDMFSRLLGLVVESGVWDLHVTGGGSVREIYSEKEQPGIPEIVTEVDAQLEHVGDQTLESPVIEETRVNDSDAQRTQGGPKEINRFRKDNNKLLPKFYASSLKTFLRRILRKSSEPRQSEQAVVLPEIPMAPVGSMEQSQAGRPVSPAVKPPPSGRIHLRTFHIHSDMLLQYTFYPWTIKTLSTASSTLTSLSFRCPDIPPATWTALFSSLSLPVLLDFEITTDLVVVNSAGATFTDLHSFLGKHPRIERLHLQGVEHPSPVPVLEKPILPNLTSVMAHPVWISSLLATRDAAHPDALSRLRSIGISTEYYLNDPTFDYDLVNEALRRVGVAKPLLPNVTLTLRFMCQDGHSDWFQRHVSDVNDSPGSVISSLSCVSTLVISAGFYVEIAMPGTMSVLPDFINLFPCVHTVQFVDMPDSQNTIMKDPGVLARLARECQRVRLVEVARREVSLEKVRKKVGEEGEDAGLEEVKKQLARGMMRFSFPRDDEQSESSESPV